MPEVALQALDAPPELRAPARRGRTSGAAGVIVAMRAGLAIASVAARKGPGGPLAAATMRHFGSPPPAPGRIAERPGATMVWVGPSQWLAVAAAAQGDQFAAAAAEALAGLASVVDQSDSRVVMHAAGPRARDALAKGVMLDLDPLVFKAGSAATTVIAKIGATLWRDSSNDGFEIAVARSYFGSFWRFLEHSAAEYGLQILAPLSGLERTAQG